MNQRNTNWMVAGLGLCLLAVGCVRTVDRTPTGVKKANEAVQPAPAGAPEKPAQPEKPAAVPGHSALPETPRWISNVRTFSAPGGFWTT